MPLVGNSDSDIERIRTTNMLIDEQTKLGKRIERLESLEFHNRINGVGCVTFLDKDTGIDAIKTVSLPGPGTGWNYSHFTIWWYLQTDDSGPLVNLYMRQDAIAANYDYTYKFTKAAALTQNSLETQAQWFIGRIPTDTDSINYASGHVFIPSYNHGDVDRRSVFGSWTCHEPTAVLNQKMEKGEFSGIVLGNTPRPPIPSSFSIFAGAGNIKGDVFLYGWCPERPEPGLGE